MDYEIEIAELKRRVTGLEGEVGGEKMLSRHIFEKLRELRSDFQELRGEFSGGMKALEHDDFILNRHHALSYCLSVIFPENRRQLFRITL